MKTGDKVERIKKAIETSKKMKKRISTKMILEMLGETDVEKSIKEFMEKSLRARTE